MSHTIAAELAARHAEARRAFETRDAAACRALFSPALAYRQKGGKVICRDALMRDVAQQLISLNHINSAYHPDALVIANGETTENLTQTPLIRGELVLAESAGT